MSDSLMEFLRTRDVRAVLAEAGPGQIERIYRAASPFVRQLIDDMPIASLRKQLLTAEAEVAALKRSRVGQATDARLAAAYQRAVAENQQLKRQLQESRKIRDDQARLLAERRAA